MKQNIIKSISFLLVFMLSGCGGMERQESNEEPKEAITLTYGYIDAYSFEDLDSTIQKQIVSFNKSQDEYFIEIVKYGNDDYAEGLKALNSDISAGKAPDIIGINNEELLYQLGKKEVVIDLYQYIDSDVGPIREDFLDNIFPCFEQDGKLYGLTPLFKIWSLVGNPTYITTENITYEQLKAMLDEHAYNNELIVCDGLTESFVLDFCVLSSVEEFVDMDNYTCDFQKETFKELLEFSMQYKDVYNNGVDTVESWAKLQQNKLCIHYTGVMGNFQEYTIFRELTGKEGFALLGFPSLGGCTPQITTNYPYLAINSESKYKDAAWQFICTFFEDEFLTDNDTINLSKGFPVTKSGFERVAKKAMLAYSIEGEASMTSAGGEIITYPLISTSEEEVAYITEIISNVEPLPNYSEIEAIICEEIEHYWNGNKTVDEVTEVIQNRVQLYLNEMR